MGKTIFFGRCETISQSAGSLKALWLPTMTTLANFCWLMHFAHEILSAGELTNQPAKELTEKELKMAEALIESMAVAWEPDKYRDEYRTAIMELIEPKAQNREIAGRPEPCTSNDQCRRSGAGASSNGDELLRRRLPVFSGGLQDPTE